MSASLRTTVLAHEGAARVPTRGLVGVAERALAETAAMPAALREAPAESRLDVGTVGGAGLDAFAASSEAVASRQALLGVDDRTASAGLAIRLRPFAMAAEVERRHAALPTEAVEPCTPEELEMAGLASTRRWGWRPAWHAIRGGWGHLQHYIWRTWGRATGVLSDLVDPLGRLSARLRGRWTLNLSDVGSRTVSTRASDTVFGESDIVLGEDVRIAQRRINKYGTEIGELTGTSVADRDRWNAATVRESLQLARDAGHLTDQTFHLARAWVAAASIQRPNGSGRSEQLVMAAQRAYDISDAAFHEAVREWQRRQLVADGYELVDEILRAPVERFEDIF